MRRIGFWKVLAPAAAVPVALWTFVALAGPGGFVGSDDDGGEPPASADAGDGDVVDGDAGGDGDCFLTVLSDGAQAYAVLQEHVSDPDKPEGGVAGNQNALDRICFGSLEAPKGNTTAVPTDADDGPGKSEDAPGKNKDAQTANDDGPGKSEDAQGAPEPKGQANGRGQATADANGNGAANAPGHNEP